MCNVYRLRASVSEIRRAAAIQEDYLGNWVAPEAIYPDYSAPIVRVGEKGLALVLARWGLPTPAVFLKGRKTDPGITNVRNVRSPHWRPLLHPANRCAIPFTSFGEYALSPRGLRHIAWFALSPEEPIGFFAGLWTKWSGIRKVKEGEITCDVFGFLTTEANKEVAAVHPKAMPVILRNKEELLLWLTVSREGVENLQRPLPDGSLVRL